MAGSLQVDRRAFLAMAVAAGTGAMVAGTGAVRARADGIDFAALKKALRGQLILPGDAQYAVAATPYNAALGMRRPAAVARIASRADVSACVRAVAGHGVPLAARSGGHSYAGYSTPDNGLVVDLAAAHTVTVHADGTAVVGAGTRLIDVYAALAANGRALPAGSCPTVGVGGSTLGGGIGVTARAYGLTCDHLKAATVVTADGRITAVDANHDADLFWALQGGGGGNGAIVTDFTFSTVPAPAVTVFTLGFAAARTASVLHAWSAWMDAAPTRITSICHVTAAKVPTNRIVGTWTGSTAGLSTQLSALISAVGAAPTTRTTRTFAYLDAMKYLAGCSTKTLTACHPSSTPGGVLGRETFRAASRILGGALSASTAVKVVALMSKQKGMVLLIDSLGGQVAKVRAADTAFVHRGAHASVQIYSGSAASQPAVDAVQQALGPLIGSGSYVNYLNPDQSDWATAYYGSNLPRLRKVITRYDPDGVFAFPQSVLRA